MTEENAIDVKISPVDEPAISPKYNIFLHQITSSRTVRAFLVVMLLITVVYLTVLGQEVPDVLTAPLLLVLGYYFGEDQNALKARVYSV